MEVVELSVYTRKKRQKKHNLKLEIQCLRIELSQLQHRHNQIVKAVLALSQGVTVATSVRRNGSNIPTETELAYINSCLGNPVEDDLLNIEDEVENLLRG